MSDDAGDEARPPYAAYQLDIYRERLMGGDPPPTTTDPEALEAQAQKVMPAEGFHYIAGGAGAELTVKANRDAFRRWRIVPRMMRPAPERDLKVKLFGEVYDTPLIMAPVGVQSAYHAEKEHGTAAACASLAVPFTLSTAASSTFESVREAVGPDASLWYQLYWPRDDDITASLLRRAKAAGCKVLVVTLDTFAMAWRPRDLDAGFLPFVRGEGNDIGFSDPVLREKFAAAAAADDEEETEAATPETHTLQASVFWTQQAFAGVARPWADLAILRRLWGDGPIVLKGVLCAADAREAVKAGMDGIVVSNHGGRQVDGSVASLDALPEVVAAVRAAEREMHRERERIGG